jgi:hypothetical protein
MLDGALGQQVAGLGGYAALMMNHSFLYAELTAYRSAQLGPPQPLDSTAASPVVRDTAPYLRAAYEVNWSTASLEVGAIGMNATLLPTNVQQDPNCKPSIPSINDATVVPCALKGLNQVRPNRFYDSGIDAQFDYIPSNEHIFTLKGVWLHEDQSWGADAGAAHASNHLDTQRVTGSYYHNRSEGIIAQWFSTTGSKDAGLYGGDGSTFGNRTNLPDSSGYVVELVYIPALNVRYSLQSVMYEKFNGAATHYDLADPKRNASDNNTLYLLAWLMF